ncbi:MAG: hypothetical protein LBQ42_13610 [Synergistaceae bacterium]|jgi:hypothetical protein|nr:hypothetical protein [Synergistaceae bacterium]
MGAKTYFKNLDRGYPGALSRVHEGGNTLESKVVAEGTTVELYVGSPVALNTEGEIVAAETAALAAKILGFVVRPYPTQGIGSIDGEDEPLQVGTVATVMRRGYMTVEVAAGTPAARGAVYVITSGTGVPLGSISAASANATQIAGAYFTGDASVDGIAEIEFNI